MSEVTESDVNELIAQGLAMIQQMKQSGYGRVMGAALFLAAAEACRRSMPEDRWAESEELAPLIVAKMLPSERGTS